MNEPRRIGGENHTLNIKTYIMKHIQINIFMSVLYFCDLYGLDAHEI